MGKGDRQLEVLKYLYANGESHKRDIYDAVSFGYQNNWDKHFGNLLNRMIDNGSIIRV